MSKFKKYYIHIMRAIAVAIPVFFIGVLLLVPEPQGPIRPEFRDDYKPERTIPKNCWDGGEGHPYPDHVMYNGTMRGQKVVDSLINEMFGGVEGPYSQTFVQYFCKLDR